MHAGISVAFLNQVNTTIISASDGSIISYNKQKGSPYRKTHLNVLASVQLNYKLGKRLSVFLVPSVKYGLKSVFKADYPLVKKINGYSICAGLRIRM
jgi:hypothetical protein